jgi:hypothetical protein
VHLDLDKVDDRVRGHEEHHFHHRVVDLHRGYRCTRARTLSTGRRRAGSASQRAAGGSHGGVLPNASPVRQLDEPHGDEVHICHEPNTSIWPSEVHLPGTFADVHRPNSPTHSGR